MKKFTLLCTALLLAAFALNTGLTRDLMSWFNTPSVTRAEISGKDGELIVTLPNTIVNKYGVLAVDALAGSSQIAVNNPGGANGLDINTLAAGDLIMVIQMSGASIDVSNTLNYGLVTNLNNAGRHEFVTVNKVQGNTITINPPCGGLRFNYTASAKVQIIRVPQYTKLTINSGASLTAPSWDGKTGGIVVVDVQNNAIINGNIDVSSLGFRGGALSGAGGGGFRTDYVTNQQDFGAEKGEGIVGYQADYDLIGGRYGRGAAANAGGGGTAHNTGGGGGANGSNSKAWTGQGVMDGATTGAAAWALDPGYIANGNKLTDSGGGGRGGYSYAVNNANALTQGPGDPAWGGDNRREVGGLGGRPVAQDTTGRIFLGGGGGAGAQNNDSGGAGSRGGGLIYIIADTVTGSGTLLANGANGGNTRNENRDGAGGAGAGGTIIVAAKTSLLAGITAQANGGIGGNQAPPVTPFNPESEGIGGGGGGGFIAFSNGSLTTQINGGANGLSQAPSISEFPANGATRGATGQAIPTIAPIPFCSTTSDLSITKTDNLAMAVPGAPLTYVIVVRNNGPNDVFGVPVTDTLPAVLTNGSWTCTPSAGSGCAAATGIGSISTTVNLLNNGTATFNLTVTPNPSATGTITNIATVTMPDGAVDTNPNNNSASDTDTLTPQADLSINKTDGLSGVIAGTDLTYTITVRNNGPSTVNSATVTDTVPSKLTNVTWTCTATAGGSCAAPSGNGSINTTVNLLPGSIATFKLRATVINSATGSLVNTATVTPPASVPDPIANNNSDTDTDTITFSADLAVTKTNNATALVAGAQTTYTIVVTNAGSSAVTGAAVADSLPAALTNATWTCTASAGSACGSANGTGSINATVDLAVGGTATFALTATVAANATGNVSNSASVTPSIGVTDPNGANNTATDTDPVTQTADLSITKTNNATTVTAGTQTTYTITARNNGPSSVTGATVIDSLSAKLSNATWTCTTSAGSSCAVPNGTGDISAAVNLAANGTATFTVTATVRADATGSLVNTAGITAPAGVTDPSAGNNTATDTDTIAASADLTITKTNNAATLVAGTQTTYTIVVSNAGPSTLIGATVTDSLPAALTNAAWSCIASAGSACGSANGTGSINTTVDLAVGGTATFALTATVAANATGNVSNSASVAPPIGVTDPNGANNTVTDTDPVTQTADLSITKTNNVTTVTAGTQTTYTITARNNGPSSINGAAVTDSLSAKLSNATWTCTASAGSSCAVPNGTGDINAMVNLAANGTATFTVTATVRADATGSLVNSASVTAPGGVTDPSNGNNTATDTDTIASSADLSILKTNNAAAVVAGTQTTYTIVVSNAGPSAVTGAAVADSLPATLTNATWTCTASAGSACGSANGTGSINTTVDLAVGGTATFALTATVAANATGNVSNSASVAPPIGVTDPNGANNTVTDTDPVTQTADLSITKTNNATTVTAGTQTTYTITARNNGPSSINGATVTDSLSAKLSNATWTCTASAGSSCAVPNGTGDISATVNLAANGTATFTVTATVRADATGSLVNSASVTAPGGVTDPSGGNNTATDTDTIASSADLSILKTNSATTVTPGLPTTYTIVASNAGPSTVAGASLTDTLPATLSNAAWTCTPSAGSSCGQSSGVGNINTTVNLLSGGSATYTLTATVSSTATGTLANTAAIAPPTGTTDPNQANNTSTASNQLAAVADLSVTKTNNVNSLTPGLPATYSIVVTNVGPSAVTGALVTDVLPSALTMGSWTCTASAGSSCSAPSGNANINNTAVNLLVGGTATFVMTATVSSNAAGTVSNTVTVAAPAGTTDPNPANNSATDTDTLTSVADLAITKTNNTTTITVGTQVTYTITATNSGPSAVTGAAVTDTLPAGLTNATWTCTASAGSACGQANGTGSIATTVNLASGGTATYTLTATVANDALGSLSNTASIAVPAGATDPVAGNNSATDTDTVIGRSNLRVAKTANPTQPVPGSTITYTIIITNDGPSPVTGATVNDPIPSPLTDAAWACTASSGSSCGLAAGTGNISTTVNLANGGTATFTLTAKIPANATGPITNTATVAAPTGVIDPESGNNSGSVTTTTLPTSDLSITKTANASVIRAGDDVTYTINVRNNGPSDAPNVVVTDPLPVGVTLVSATSTQGACSGTTTVTCNIGTLTAAAPGNTAVVTIRINVPFTFPVGPLANTAVVSSPVTDPTSGNNSGGSTITVNPPPGAQFKAPDIAIRTFGSDVCIGGGNVLNIEAKLKNSGNGIQRNDPASPEFVALLPTQLTAQTGSCTAFIDGAATGACTLTAAQVEWNGEIPAGKTLVVTFQVRVRNNVQPGDRFCTTFRINYDTDSDSVNDTQLVVTDCQTANCSPPPCTGSDCPDFGFLGLDKQVISDTGSDQRPGSVLIYPIYTSSVTGSTAQNTRISITNTNSQRPAYLHLFFVDGTSCSVADNFLCLTPNQTTAFLISDLDPGVTGYVIAVAVDSKGCPTNFNYLIGDEYVKLSTGHAANLGAEAIPATFAVLRDAQGNPILDGQGRPQLTDPFICQNTASLATLFFDAAEPTATERHYARLGRVLAADNLPSRADGNDTQIVVNRIGGNLGLGADPLGALFGIFYNDSEAAVSFSFSRSTCQLFTSISNDFPRTTPRFEQFVPAGRSGWLKVGLPADGAIVGAVINSTTNTNGFKGGHNLHKLTLGTTSLTMPVFPPSCQ